MRAIDAFLTAGTIFTSRPGYIWVGDGIQQWSSAAKNQGPVFYFPDFFLTSPRPWLSHAETREVSIGEFAAQLKQRSAASALEPLQWVTPHAPLFATAFKDLQQQFAEGMLQKAVPYVIASAKEMMSRERLLHVLQHALAYVQEQPAFLYGTWDMHGGILGVTPEQLFAVRDNHLETMACAGTRSTANAPEKLLHDPKELHEHRLVVEGIIESLRSYGVPKIGLCRLMKLPHVSHLVTPIEMELPHAIEFDDLVRALHPTPALGSFPREAGMQWLRQYHQKLDRQRYGAPVGYRDQQVGRCVVAIRNVQWDERGMQIAAGCGVVAASQLEQEWQEIQTKIRAIREIIGL